MKTFRVVAVMLLLVSLAAGASSVAAQQRQQGQQQAQQAAMQHHQQQQAMQAMVERMNRLVERANLVSQHLAQQLQQRGQARDQDRALQQLCDSYGDMTRQMQQSMDRIHQLTQDPTLQNDPDMQRDMDRLREHVGTMADQLDEALNIMDRVTQRLRIHDSGGR
jgi:peptidoglycan hydrolase CwlO-like protein